MNDVIWSFMEMNGIICAFESSQVDKCTKIKHKYIWFDVLHEFLVFSICSITSNKKMKTAVWLEWKRWM